MKRNLAVWILCVSLLLIGSVASAGDKYEVLELQPGDCVQEQGNFVHDPFIEACRELQVLTDGTEGAVNEAPAREGRGFINGVGVGAVLVIILQLL